MGGSPTKLLEKQGLSLFTPARRDGRRRLQRRLRVRAVPALLAHGPGPHSTETPHREVFLPALPLLSPLSPSPWPLKSCFLFGWFWKERHGCVALLCTVQGGSQHSLVPRNC